MATATNTSRTNNAEIDGLLSGTRWTGTITYSFPDSPSDYPANYYGYGEPTASGFGIAPSAMQQAIVYAFALISSYTNITVQYAGNGSADIMVAQSPEANPTSYAYYPANVPAGGDIWFGTAYPYAQAKLGNYYFATALHELGHSLGLKHSQETGGVANVAVPTAHDSSEFTVMSYRSYVGAPLTGYTAESYGYAQTYMANDILALQTMYGANYSTNSGNTVYSWNATTGQQYINGVAQLAPGNGVGGSANRVFETVWDGNGIDTYDLSNYGTGVTINLNPGASSITSSTQIAYLGNGHYAQGNIFNAYLYNNDARSYIDNAIGGSGNDSLTGNVIANTLTGGGGNDTLIGGGGNDALIGGAGTDTAIFSGNSSDYLISYNATTQVYTLADQRSGTPDGTETASGIEYFGFADGTFASSNFPNQAPVATINDHSVSVNAWAQVSSWVNYSDADGNAATRYQFWDGGSGANSAYIWTPNNYHNNAETEITVAASDLANVWIRGGTAGGSETMFVRAFDGIRWSAWDSFVFTTIPNTAPVATINDHSANANTWAQVSSWVNYSDADGNAATQYQFWDGGSGANSAYFWTPNNYHHAAETEITVAASDLANVWIRGGTAGGSETMFVRAFDGTGWSAWDSFVFTTIPNTAPVATINDHSVTANTWAQVSSWVNYSDADGNAATQYQFWDGGSGANSAYIWTPNNYHNNAETEITVAASDLANVWIRGGTAGGSETMFVRAFDGTGWSAWDSFVFTTIPNTAPVATINDHSATANTWAQVSSWVNYSDADGNAATQYQFWDGGSGANSAYIWTPNNYHNNAETEITVAASDLANVWIRGGTAGGSETMFVRAFDGTGWSAWDSFVFTTIPNTAPVATINDHSVNANTWAQVSSWVNYSDADGNAATQYQFWDGGSGANSAYIWTPNNYHNNAETEITVAASDLANVWIRGGTAGGSETMFVRAFDGTGWSAWDMFGLTTV